MIYPKEMSLYLILTLPCSSNRLVIRKSLTNVLVFIVYRTFSAMNPIVVDPNNPGRISLAYRDLTELPTDWDGKFDDITVLDLSHNNLTYPL